MEENMRLASEEEFRANECVNDVNVEENSVTLDLEKTMALTQDARMILVEHYHNHNIVSKISLGLSLEGDAVNNKINTIVKEAMGEEVPVDGDDEIKFASTEHDTLVFYIYPLTEEKVIWTYPDMDVNKE